MSKLHDEYFFVVAVKGNFDWPDQPVRLEYCGNRFRLIPPGEDRYANVVLELPSGTVQIGARPEDYDEHLTIVNRFLSALSWTMEAMLHIHGVGRGGSKLLAVKGLAFRSITRKTPSGLWIPEIADPDAQRALALMREARSAELMFPSVAFLWFYKAIEVCFGTKHDQLNPFFDRCHDLLKVEALAKYDAWRAKGQKHESFGDYIRQHRRNSVAHAFESPMIDPDDAGGLRELNSELPLISELAKFAIRERFKVPGLLELKQQGQASKVPPGWFPLEKVDP